MEKRGPPAPFFIASVAILVKSLTGMMFAFSMHVPSERREKGLKEGGVHGGR